ncbi:MAG: SpoIID/LytB domain-containing protein [Dysgonamonadaceae bacterium]|jgi:SpoIID/LytB domain protein|nr:SpoIID/LytB domain-containing protein [Dysgonamonadaceae bacterium]
MNIPTIEVGIMSAKSIEFQLNGCFRQVAACEETRSVKGEATVTGSSSFILSLGGKQQIFNDFVLLEPTNEDDANFELYHVIIGVQFHWEREETQRFKGKLKIYVENGMLTAVNILSVEDYLLSVISSEMSATSSLELLKAHAIISRSWLLAQIEKGRQLKDANYKTLIRNEEGYLRWYDREDHSRFDVCADDHCQRYQGITKVSARQVYEALKATSGEVLLYDNKICDARFYKCCGGITEKFENVWEPVVHPYLTKVVDNDMIPSGYNIDLTDEDNARAWILGNPPAFCNTHDKTVLSQVLNDYDQETQDFYRWQITLTQAEIKDLLFRKVGINVGDILDLIPIERGVSGRLIRLKIIGSEGSMIIGKELEIRKALSESHLYSSAFVVEKKSDSFVLKGAGWGHGVGLCQIGAAIMGAKGYPYQEILTHYFPHAELKKIY